MEPMQPLCKVQVHEGGEATGFEKLQVPEFVGFGLVDTRGLHNSQRISWNLNKSLDSLCSGGGEVMPKRHVSCCETNGKSLSSLSGSVLCFLVFSKFLNFGLETMYSTKQLQLTTPRGTVFVYHLWSIWVMLPPTGLRGAWNGLAEVWDWTPMGFGWWYDVYI